MLRRPICRSPSDWAEADLIHSSLPTRLRDETEKKGFVAFLLRKNVMLRRRGRRRQICHRQIGTDISNPFFFISAKKDPPALRADLFWRRRRDLNPCKISLTSGFARFCNVRTGFSAHFSALVSACLPSDRSRLAVSWMSERGLRWQPSRLSLSPDPTE